MDIKLLKKLVLTWDNNSMHFKAPRKTPIITVLINPIHFTKNKQTWASPFQKTESKKCYVYHSLLDYVHNLSKNIQFYIHKKSKKHMSSPYCNSPSLLIY